MKKKKKKKKTLFCVTTIPHGMSRSMTFTCLQTVCRETEYNIILLLTIEALNMM